MSNKRSKRKSRSKFRSRKAKKLQQQIAYQEYKTNPDIAIALGYQPCNQVQH